MNITLTFDHLDGPRRERALIALIVLAALASGIFAALASGEWLATVGIVAVTCVAAMTAPLSLLPLILAGLAPFQLYFFLGSSSFTLRAALVFETFAALRLLPARDRAPQRSRGVCGRIRDLGRVGRREIVRGQSPSGIAGSATWMVPAALFLLAAAAAALGAQDKYLALKGIYEWLPVFVAAFVVGALVTSAAALRRIVFVLIAGGVLEALLGLLQYAAGIDAVISVLRQPIAKVFFQPNLLEERLADLSFNWITLDRVVPFGTFVNAIDYAVFIAAILSLVIALAPACRGRLYFGVLFLSALSLGAALLLTLKASGLIAFAGGAATVVLFFSAGAGGTSNFPRLSTRAILVGLACLLVAVVLFMLFGEPIMQRLVFLALREQGAFGTPGRLEIWGNLIQFLAQRPFFGFGLNNATFLIEPARTLSRGITAFNPTNPESAYLAALIETGAVGFVALISLLAILVARALGNIRANAEPVAHVGILAAIVALLLGNLTATGLTTDQNGMLLGVLMGLVFGSQSVASRLSNAS